MFVQAQDRLLQYGVRAANETEEVKKQKEERENGADGTPGDGEM